MSDKELKPCFCGGQASFNLENETHLEIVCLSECGIRFTSDGDFCEAEKNTFSKRWNDFPRPITSKEDDKECKNPNCDHGKIRVSETRAGDAYHFDWCPDCQKDQAIQEERKGE